MTSSVETPDTGSDKAGRAAVLPGLPGLPWWGAVLLALALSVAGAVVDRVTGSLPFDGKQFPGIGLQVGFYVGVILAVLLVRRRALYTAAVQPPLILIVTVIGTLRFGWGQGLTGSAVPVVSTFPTMAIGTAAVLVLAVIRLLAQPLKPQVSHTL